MGLLERLRDLGASAWIDGPPREWIESAEAARWVEASLVTGAILTPAPLQDGLLQDERYLARLRPLAQAGWAAERAIEALSVEEARSAADLFLPLFERTNGRHGLVSVGAVRGEAFDAESLVPTVARLWSEVNRPNVLIQLPATANGLAAFEQVLARGMNAHLTVIHSLERYAEALEAFLRALDQRLADGASVDHVGAALSFAPLAVEIEAEGRLEEVIRDLPERAERARALHGQTAGSLARLAHAQWRAALADERFRALVVEGLHAPRLLWIVPSTGDVPPTRWGGWVAEGTILALPRGLLQEPPGAEVLRQEVEGDLASARGQLDGLLDLGVSLPSLAERTEKGEQQAVRKLSAAFVRATDRRLKGFRTEVSTLMEALQETLGSLDRASVGRRLWQKDPSLWSDRPEAMDEIRRRLGWLDLPVDATSLVGQLQGFAKEIRKDGLRHVVLLGMGGSSLAADVMHRTLASDRGLGFCVLDTTDPAVVLAVGRQTPIRETLFIVASKSGTTTEPLALLEHFWVEALRRVGSEASRHFVAITDPGTALESLAHDRGFRCVFSGPPEVGGRYSALSVFGLLPAALMDVDLPGLLRGAGQMAHACRGGTDPIRNPGLFLGAALAAAAGQGLTQVTFLSDPGLEPLEDWLEQLVAESSGKDGLGLLPVVHEPPGPPGSYRGQPRVMVYLRRQGVHDPRVRTWSRAGLPVIVIETGGEAPGIGGEFFRWEVATAVSCHLLQVNAFDQPDVQRAKSRTVEVLRTYRRKGALPDMPTLWEGTGVRLMGERPPDRSLGGVSTPKDAARWVLDQTRPGEAFGLLLYLPQTRTLDRRVAGLRRELRDRWGVTVTAGYGPRYLHSTGQLHKGGPGTMAFLAVTAEPRRDLAVPEAGYTFGTLQKAQALGDLQALLGLGRRAFGLHLDRAARADEILAAFAAAEPPPNRRSTP